jgi:hypothetical protein
MAEGVEPWMAIDYGEVLQALAETKQMELGAVSTVWRNHIENQQGGGDRAMAVSPSVGCVQGISIRSQERVCQLKH